jgi:hypothetical protein
MNNMFLERRFEPPVGHAEVIQMALDSIGCFGIHRVKWHGSFLANDGGRMFCWLSAPDMESARIALRQVGTDIRVLWQGDVFDGPGIGENDITGANVIVERSFDESVTLQQIQDIEDAGIGCLQTRNVRFVRTFFSADRKRMICLYEAPDAESVRQSQREASVPFHDAWAFRRVSLADIENLTS